MFVVYTHVFLFVTIIVANNYYKVCDDNQFTHYYSLTHYRYEMQREVTYIF